MATQKMFGRVSVVIRDLNEENRQAWLRKVLGSIPTGSRLLDAGAGEQKNKIHCAHLDYVSQDFCQYNAADSSGEGLDNRSWDTSKIDIVSDISNIPLPDHSFDAVLCSEVFEHIPDPNLALDEFSRLLKPGGILIITAPFASIVHMAPYYYSSGFSKYWYECQLPRRGLELKELSPNGDWFSFLRQEITRLGGMERKLGNWSWPLAYAYSLIGMLYFKIRSKKNAPDVGCFGWHCVAVKSDR